MNNILELMFNMNIYLFNQLFFLNKWYMSIVCLYILMT